MSDLDLVVLSNDIGKVCYEINKLKAKSYNEYNVHSTMVGDSAVNIGLIDENSDLNRDIRTVFSTFSTHEEKEDGKVTSSAESLYDEMVDCLSKTEGTKPIMAISSPFYLSHYFEKRNTKTYDNVVKFIEKLQKESNGMLVAFESFSPNYRKDQYIDMDEVERFNDYMRKKTGLYEVGGDFDHALNGST